MSGQTASVLQKAEVRIVNSTVCKNLMSDDVTDRMLCAGVLKGGVDACQVTVTRQNSRSTTSTSPTHSCTHFHWTTHQTSTGTRRS